MTDLESLQALFTAERLLAMGASLVRITAILVAVFVATKIVRRWFSRWTGTVVSRLSFREEEPFEERSKRATTLSNIFTGALIVVLWTVGIVMTLKQAGFDVAPILAGVGVVGLAVGFGAQNLVRDVISGAMLLLENQVRIGDVAIVNGTGGFVERINLRTITLRSQNGAVHVFPHGSVTSLTNMTCGFSFYVFDLGVAYKEDTDHVIAVVQALAEELRQEEPYASEILEPLEVLGVDAFADSAVVIKMRIKTKPIKQWLVGREMNRRIKKKFDEVGIEIPFPHRSIYFGEASKPFSVQHAGDREAVKQLIREVLAEQQDQLPQPSTPTSALPK